MAIVAFAGSLLEDDLKALSEWRWLFAGLALLWGAMVIGCAGSLGPDPLIGGALTQLEQARRQALGRQWLMTRLDAWLEPREGWFGYATVGLLDKALLFAVLYPIFLPLLGWAASGSGVTLGTLELLPNGVVGWQRYLMLSGLAPLVLIILYESASKDRVSGLWKLTSRAVAFAVAFAVIGAFSFAGAVARRFARAFAVADADKFALALAGAFAVAVACALAAAGAFAVVGAFAFAVIGALAVVFAVTRLGRYQPRYLPYAYAGFFILMIGELIHAAWSIPWPQIDSDAYGVFLFLGVLPLINGVFDFVSYAVTLTLLRWGLRLRPIWSLPLAILDIMAAAVIFLLLGGSLILIVQALNAVTGVVFFDFTEMAAAFRTGDIASFWWVPAMVFSTVLPTGLHLAHAAVSTFVLAPAWAAPGLARVVSEASYKPWAMIWAPIYATGVACGFLAIWGGLFYLTVGVPGIAVFEGAGALWEPARQVMTGYLGLFEAWHGLVSDWFPTPPVAAAPPTNP